MTMTATEYGVLVAVGPEGIHDGALTFAAAEALRRGTGVELFHVVHSLMTVPASAEQMQALDVSLTECGRLRLTDASNRLRPLLDDQVPMTAEIRTGPVAAEITERAAAADLVVLERRDVGTVERLLTMSVSTRVAAHALVPVAVVPETWAPQPEDELPVVVGVDTPTDPVGQVEAALAYAGASGRSLEVLHAAWLAEPWEDLAFGNYSRDRWVQDADHELEMALAKLPETSVEITREVQWRRPVDALVGATRRSAVLVLNRRAEHALAPHLGSTTRAVLRHARGPVLVVDRT